MYSLSTTFVMCFVGVGGGDGRMDGGCHFFFFCKMCCMRAVLEKKHIKSLGCSKSLLVMISLPLTAAEMSSGCVAVTLFQCCTRQCHYGVGQRC